MFEEHPLTRQIRLREVGVEGQARINAASVEVRGRDGSLTELVYLHRAGVERAAILPEKEPVPFAHAELFRQQSSRRSGAGAWRALAQLRTLLTQVSDSP